MHTNVFTSLPAVIQGGSLSSICTLGNCVTTVALPFSPCEYMFRAPSTTARRSRKRAPVVLAGPQPPPSSPDHSCRAPQQPTTAAGRRRKARCAATGRHKMRHRRSMLCRRRPLAVPPTNEKHGKFSLPQTAKSPRGHVIKGSQRGVPHMQNHLGLFVRFYKV